MNKLKRTINSFKNVLPKDIKLKRIYIMAFLNSLFEILTLFVVSYFGIDIAFKKNSVSLFVVTMIAIVVILAGSNIVFTIAYKNGNDLTKKINVKVREKLFKKIMDLDKEYHNNHPTGGTINTLVGDVEMISNEFFWVSLYAVINVSSVIISVTLAFIVNWKASLILVILGPIIWFFMKLMFGIINKIDEDRRKNRRKVLSHVNDGIMGIKTIKSLCLENKNYNEYKNLTNTQIKLDAKKTITNQFTWRFIDLLVAVAIGILFYLSYKEYSIEALSYGGLYLLFLLFDKCLYSIASISDQYDSFSEILISIRRIDEILNLEPLIKDKENIELNPKPLKGKIEFDNVTFKYPKGEVVLKDFSLKIEPRKKVAIVGRTGSGKSTIVSLIYRFYEPSEGKILFDDNDYLNLPQRFIRSNIGFILQDALLFDDTVFNNLKYSKKDATLEEVKEVARKIGLDEFIDMMPNGYDTKVGEGGLLLSNGQKQLIAFARVLLKNPDIIILDEATSSIDSKTEQLIQKCINEQFKDKTCIFIAHRLSTIQDVDTIICLEKGKIVESGNHTELMDKEGKYYKLYMSQFYNKVLNETLQIEVEE